MWMVQDFDTLAIEHKDAVYRQLIRACGNEQDAEDVLVEALLKAYQSLHQLREQKTFRAWLAQIGRRVCWHLKAREALAPLVRLSTLEDQGTELADTAPSPEVELGRKRLRALIADAIAELDEPSRAVYEMRDVEGLSGAETAARLGLTLVAQKSRLHRARAQVRDALDRRLLGDE
jgi:RNA polymerase sigma-70 factor, ECF subfamily